jgi:hypothetical protein
VTVSFNSVKEMKFPLYLDIIGKAVRAKRLQETDKASIIVNFDPVYRNKMKHLLTEDSYSDQLYSSFHCDNGALWPHLNA